MGHVFDQVIAELIELALDSSLEKEEAEVVDEYLSGLIALNEELGDDLSDEEIVKHLLDYGVDFLLEDGEDDGEEDDEDRISLEDFADTIEHFLENMGFIYTKGELSEDLLVYRMGLKEKDKRLKIRIYCQINPANCQIKATLPYTCDPLYQYPLCVLLGQKNKDIHYGSFTYDEVDGKVAYVYRFSTQCGLMPEELFDYFDTAVTSAFFSYDDIRRYCRGQFNQDEKKEILDKARCLIEDMVE